ncbi:MAG TPA: Gldg family protein, partial [Pseudomonadales bacterium]|nr:Gldg family protein [Pseudomonadales bacterium]
MKTKKLFSGAGLIALAVILVVSTWVFDSLFQRARFDLTESKLYTLSDGSKNIVKSLSDPIELQFFFSDKVTQDIPQLRNYAKRVQELLEEYQLNSNGKIKLEVVDPEPFSEAEDKAAEAGLQSVPLNQSGSQVYFGLVATGKNGKKEVIPFFQLDKEELLEYDISKLIYSLNKAKQPVLGLLTGLQMSGGFDFMSRAPNQPWVILSQLRQLYDVRTIEANAGEIKSDIDLLLLVQPKNLTPKTLYAIDQYVLRGGKVVVFEDPLAESDQMAMMSGDTQQGNPLASLFKAWGVEMKDKAILGDAENSLRVPMDRNGPPVRHLALLRFTSKNFTKGEVVTANLSQMHFSSAGILAPVKEASTKFIPLIESYTNSMAMDQGKFGPGMNPESLLDDFKAGGEKLAVAARIEGKAKTAFPDGAPAEEKKDDKADKKDDKTDAKKADEAKKADAKPEQPKAAHLAESTGDIHVVVVADTDVLTDRLWVQTQEFMGQTVAVPFADNGNFATNLVDNLAGSADLISVRSRGQYSRPFTRVENLQRKAEMNLRSKEKQLQSQLDETEKQLNELQAKKSGDEKQQMTLTPEQENAIKQ